MIIKIDPDIIKSYLEDSSNLKGGYADEVVIPSSIEELSRFIKEANSSKRPVTVSGGGTATTGSRIPFGGAVVSTEKINRILKMPSDETGEAIVETGVLVDELKAACEHSGLFYTSHPTEGTASVGGTVATNASGSRSLKYGPTRKFIRRLKMVMATGEIFELRRGQILVNNNSAVTLPGGRTINIPLPTYKMPSVKSSAGYFVKPGMDLIDLFIGQEGTLSIIAEIGLGVVKKPGAIFSAFVFFNEERDAWRFAVDAKAVRGVLSIEYFDENSLNLLRGKFPNMPSAKPAAIFFEQETGKGREAKAAESWIGLIERNNSSMDDTWAAMGEKDALRFAEIRHALPEAVNDIYRKSGFKKLSLDIAVPDAKFNEMLSFYMDALRRERLDHVIFGHIGESHPHVNILPKSIAEDKRSRELAMEFVKKGLSLGGTVSAEHGIGKLKHKYLEEMYGRTGMLEMARLKKAFDPNCILGLGNIFPKEYLELV